MNRVWAKRALVIAGSVLVIGGTTLGVSYAQAPTGSPPSAGQRGARMEQLLGAVATNLGVSTDQLQQAFQSARTQLGYTGHGQGGDQAHRWAAGHRGQKGMMGARGRAAGMDAVSQALGMTPQQLRQELPGKSLTDLAQAQNVDPSVVANALKAQADGRIDQLMTQTVPVREPRS